MSTIVRTQQELDDALAARAEDIVIDSPAGVWLRVAGSVSVRVVGSATVRASGWVTVRASGSVTVRASGSVTVRASGSATVWATDSVTVWATGSVTVRASGSVTVWATGWVTVRATGWVTVRASGSVTVWATDWVTVRASGWVTVRATDSVTVWAWDAATVRAGSHVAVHLHSRSATVHGGVVIDHTAVDLTDPVQWCDYYGVAVVDGTAVVVKYVGPDLASHYGTVYPVGETVTAPDYNGRPECGGGLHFAATPAQAVEESMGAVEGGRWLECEIDLSRAVGVTGKIKAASCRVLREVDAMGRPVETEGAACRDEERES